MKFWNWAAVLVVGTQWVLPSAALEVSEVLADNQGGLRDEDGDSPGWIELHQPAGADPVTLEGWSLTDDPLLPRKWLFPAITVLPGQFLVVFASGKDRAAGGQPLHTNFKLNPAGEYLGLVDPGGHIAGGSGTVFPALRRNQSTAIRMAGTEQSLLPESGSMLYFVPGDASVDALWHQVDFEDTGWLQGIFPAGFGRSSGTALEPIRLDFNDREADSTLTTQSEFTSFVLGDAGGIGAVQTGPVGRTIGGVIATLSSTGPEGIDDRNRQVPGDSGTLTTGRLLRDFVFSRDQTGNGGLDLKLEGLPPGQSCRITIWSYDSSSTGNRVSDWSANEVLVREDYTFNGSTLPASDGHGQFMFEAVPDAAGELRISGRRDPKSSTFGVFLNAVEVAPVGPRRLVVTDLTEAMAVPGKTSAYFRVPFPLNEPGAWESLILRCRYGDGFAAWINGVPVASRLAPPAVGWNSTATAEKEDTAVDRWEEIEIPLQPGLLRNGMNLLALQGLNFSAADPDFFLDAALKVQGPLQSSAVYFAMPTPGAANGPAFAGVAALPVANRERGFESAPVDVSLSCATPGAQIRYTLDGSLPTAPAGLLYTGPFAIQSTTTLRAISTFQGYLPSEPQSWSWIFPAETAQQPKAPVGWPADWGFDSEVAGLVPADYEMDPEVVSQTGPGYSVATALEAIPVISLTLPPGDFLGPAGIYQSPRSTGEAWEKVTGIEFFDPRKQEPSFADQCLIEIHGNSSRRPFRVQKHSFRLTFQGQVGSSRLKFPLFPGSPVQEYNQLVLRACFTDAWCLVSWDPSRYRPDDATYLRDLWMKQSHAAMGSPAAQGRFCHLYINGLYWGMYIISERIDEDFVASHLGGEAEDWEVVSDFVDPDSAPDSTWKTMFSLANSGLGTPEAYAAIQKWLDPVNFTDYYLLHQFGETEDWPHHNGYAYRRRSGPDTRYKWLTWDQEIALNNHGIDRVKAGAANTGVDRTPGRLLNQLRANAEYRLLFADRAWHHLQPGGALDIPNSQTRWMKLAAEADYAIVAESARWGDTAEETPYGNTGFSRPGIPLKPVYTREADWLPTVLGVRDQWIPSLHSPGQSYATLKRLQAAGLYPSVPPPSLSPSGGIYQTDVLLTLIASQGEIWFTTDGTDPREPLTGNPRGTRFEEPVLLTGLREVRARAFHENEWSAMTSASFSVAVPPSPALLRIAEIAYDPPEGADQVEFIELINLSPSVLDLTGVAFTEGIGYQFPFGTLLRPGERLVVDGNQFTGKLDNSGEILTLTGPGGVELFRFRYGVLSPWPEPNGVAGGGLVMMDPAADPSAPASWRPPLFPGGTPGTSDAHQFLGEAAADPDDDGAGDFLEYAFGTNSGDPAERPEFSVSTDLQGQWQIQFERSGAADDAGVLPEWSVDGLRWDSTGVELKSRHRVGAQLRETWSVPPWKELRGFVRLRAGKP